MIKNYLKIAVRNLKRNKSYAFINTSGLAVGIGACLLIFLVIQFETSFDTFHSNKKNIYRVVSEFQSFSTEERICFVLSGCILKLATW